MQNLARQSFRADGVALAMIVAMNYAQNSERTALRRRRAGLPSAGGERTTRLTEGDVSEAFCVLYKDGGDPPSKRLSRSYASLEQAISAAREVFRRKAVPLQIRGTEGTVIEKAELEKAIAVLAA
jgi:hypothetical protein